MILQPVRNEVQPLIDNGVIGTGLYETLVQSESESLAFPFADALADVPSSVDKDDVFASASKSLRLRLVIASMIA
jgi:hypothetical protein